MNIPEEKQLPDGTYDIDTYMKERKKFIRYCIDKKMSYSEIGKLLGVTKQRIYNIYRYGNNRNGGLMKSTKKEIKDRDNNKCKICSSRKNLACHHIGNPKDNRIKNIMTLCNSCHRKIHILLEQKQKIKKILNSFTAGEALNPITAQSIGEKLEQIEN